MHKPAEIWLNRRVLQTVLTFLMLQPGAATADCPGNFSPLNSGMRYVDVARLWGNPESRREDESAHHSVWVYGNGQVIFQDGSVVAWVVPCRVAEAAPTIVGDLQAGSVEKDEPAVSNEKVEKVLGEIMEGLPTIPDGH